MQVKVVEGDRERVQAYEGVVIAKKNRGLNSSFTVRKISHGEGVERVFQTLQPLDQRGQCQAARRGAAREALLPARPVRQGGAHRREDLSTAGSPVARGRCGAPEWVSGPRCVGFFWAVWRILEGIRKCLHLVLLLVIFGFLLAALHTSLPTCRIPPRWSSPPRASWSSSCPATRCAARSGRPRAGRRPRRC